MSSDEIRRSASVTVETILSAEAFAAFSRFNAFRIGGRGLALVLFPLAMAGMGAVHWATGSPTLFFVFCAIGVVLPAGYLAFFSAAVRRQIEIHRLREPRVVYGVKLDEKGIAIRNERERIEYGWERPYRVYLTDGYAYLYMAKGKAFILPYESVAEGTAEELVELLRRRLGAERVRDLRKRRAARAGGSNTTAP